MFIAQADERAFEYCDRLSRVKQYVMEHYHQGRVSLSEAAGVACLEPKYFSKYFHKNVGVTFQQWLMGVRVSEAAKVMNLSENSITEVSYLAGFEDLRTFERAFKQYTGLSPRHYRDAARRTTRRKMPEI